MKTLTTKRKQKSSEPSNTNFYRIQGLTIGFFEWVLKRETRHNKIYNEFKNLLGHYKSLAVTDNYFLGFVNFALKDRAISKEDFSKLLTACKHFNDDILFGWLSEESSKFLKKK